MPNIGVTPVKVSSFDNVSRYLRFSVLYASWGSRKILNRTRNGRIDTAKRQIDENRLFKINRLP